MTEKYRPSNRAFWQALAIFALSTGFAASTIGTLVAVFLARPLMVDQVFLTVTIAGSIAFTVVWYSIPIMRRLTRWLDRRAGRSVQ